MTFFFDRCVPVCLAHMVAILERGTQLIVHHDDDPRFRPTTTDVEWLSAVGKDRPKPAVISGDARILKRPDEARELRSQNLTFFCLASQWQDMSIQEQAWKFLKVWPEIIRNAEEARQPTVFQVQAGGSLKVEVYSLTKDIVRK
jgi:hypothetical protein